MELTAQIAAMYLGQKCQADGICFTMRGLTLFNLHIVSDGDQYAFPLDQVKPILRPLSSLTEAEARELYEMLRHEVFEPQTELSALDYVLDSVELYDERMTLAIGHPAIWLKLLSWGFDLFELIESGAAIDAAIFENEK